MILTRNGCFVFDLWDCCFDMDRYVYVCLLELAFGHGPECLWLTNVKQLDLCFRFLLLSRYWYCCVVFIWLFHHLSRIQGLSSYMPWDLYWLALLYGYHLFTLSWPFLEWVSMVQFYEVFVFLPSMFLSLTCPKFKTGLTKKIKSRLSSGRDLIHQLSKFNCVFRIVMLTWIDMFFVSFKFMLHHSWW